MKFIRGIVVFLFCFFTMGFCIAEDLNLNILLGKGGTGLPTLPNTKNHIVKGVLVAPNGKQYFFTDKRYFRLSAKDGLEKIANIQNNWTRIPNNIDGVFVHPANKKAYFFKGDKYNRWDFKNGNDNNELAISRFWKGVPNNIDAVTNHTNGKVYFFKDDKYHRYDTKLKKVDKVDLIRKNWKGVPNNVSAAFLHKNGKVYFFKDKGSVPGYVNYFRFDIKLNKVDKIGYIGIDGWKDLDFKKKNFVKKITQKTVVQKKDNIRLKVILTRVKSVQARDSDNIADFLLDQKIDYSVNSKTKIAFEKSMKRYRYERRNPLVDPDDYIPDLQSIIDNTLIHSWDDQIHIREGDEKHYINNSLVFEISDKEAVNKRAVFKVYTNLTENDGVSLLGGGNDKKIARNHYINVNIYEVLDYLKNPSQRKYGGNYFKGGKSGDMHEYGAFGDVMWFKKGSNNSLIGHLEFGDNKKETYVRFYYRFELIP